MLVYKKNMAEITTGGRLQREKKKLDYVHCILCVLVLKLEIYPLRSLNVAHRHPQLIYAMFSYKLDTDA